MGDIIVSNDFVDLGTITSISETAGYDDDNVGDYWHLKRRFRAGGAPTSDASYLLKFDFGAAKSVIAVILNDVNFDIARIRAHATDLGVNWAASTYSGLANNAIGRDERVERYKIYIPAVFNLQWMIVQVPVGAVAVGDYGAKWEVGSVVVLATAPNCAKNAYSRSAIRPFEDIVIPSGGVERVGLNDNLMWEGSISIDTRAEVDENQNWALNVLDTAKPLIFYENRLEDDKVYLCLRDDAYVGNLIHQGLVTGNAIRFKELA